MGTLGNPKLWVPYINPKDCSQGFCSISCPQWCYLIFPPPPPSSFPFPLDSSSSSSSTALSPVMITIIGVLGSALLLISYYAILSKYCGSSEASRTVENNQPSLDDDDEEVEDGHDHNNPSEHEPWVITRVGLDEALIKSITQVKYNKGDGVVGSGDCSVCLGEFQDDEALRLLPKCSHAFHVECIDTWLRSHLNCPLCRAPIFSTTQPPPPQPPSPPPPMVVDGNSNNLHPQDHEPLTQTQIANEQEEGNHRPLPKSPFQGSRDHELHEGVQGHKIRRSISMDHCHETRVSISGFDPKEGAGESSNSSNGGSTSVNNGNGVLDCVMNSVGMKRSFSSGRFLFMSKHGRGRNAIIPL